MQDRKPGKPPPFAPVGLDHLLLLVNDLDAAVQFYEQVAGCTLRVRLPQWAMAELDAGSNSLDLVDYQAPEGAWARPETEHGRNIDHFALALATADETAVRGHLAAHRVAIHEERVEDGRLSLYVRDPAGNVVELRLLARP